MLGTAGIAGLVVLLIPGLSAMPLSPSLAIGPTYHTQCYGTQQGSIQQSSYGTTSGGVWKDQYGPGLLHVARQLATGSHSGKRTQGWISMGPGPTNGKCFRPSSSTGTLRYTFTNVSYSVFLRSNCSSSDNSTGSASYMLTLQGNIYDLTTARFVWFGNLAHRVNSTAVGCSSGSVQTLSQNYTGLGPFYVKGSTSSFSSVDYYWFIVDAELTVRTTSTGTGVQNLATVSSVWATLSTIQCSTC